MKNRLPKILSIILAFILTLGNMLPAFAADEIPEGYTPIYTAEDLNNIRNNLTGSFILMNDIDLSEYNWVAIGTYEEAFTGTFDGNNKVIDNLSIQIFTEESFMYASFFGAVSGGVIKNTTIKNCDIDVDAKAAKYWGVHAAGLVGLGNKGASIENCIATGDIYIRTDNGASVGGIGGGFSGKITNCKSQVNIAVEIPYDITSWVYVGGVSGSNSVEINESCNYGNLSVTYNRTKVHGGVYIGGIVGESLEGNINNCYNIGNIAADTNQALHLGGISGYSTTAMNCHNYSAFSVPEGDYAVGGISGLTEFWAQPGISLGPSEPVVIAELTNCYYSNEGIPSTHYSVPELMTNVKYLTTEEFKTQESFTGFDFENVWIMNEEETYPVLRNEPKTIEEKPEPTPDPNPNPNPNPTPDPDPEPNSPLLWLVNLIKKIWNFIIGTAKMLFA